MSKRENDHGVNHETPAENKRTKQNKGDDLSDDEWSDFDDDDEVFHGVRIPSLLPPLKSSDEHPKSAGPRIIIKNIIVDNFKSFYGKVTIGSFHKSLTSIVGANGSGKSNVIDSLLFVFGYRSTKIRSKKVSALIHNSEKHKDISQCSVTVNFVHINDEDSQGTRFVPIPGSEISITRTAFKDSSSFYTLNNKRVRFKEVANVLKKNGIDIINNRFLILQGEVEQIAMMKPKAENEHSTGMLEYIEDIIGTVRYEKAITKLEENIKVIAVEKSEKITLFKSIAKSRDELIDPAMAVIKYLKMENHCSFLLNKQNQILIYNEKKIRKIKIEELNLIKEKLNSIKVELAVVDENKKEKKKIFDKLSKELALNVEKSTNYQNKLDDAVKDDIKLVDDNKLLEEEKNSFETTIKTEKKKICKAESMLKHKKAELELLQSQLVPLEDECIKMQENYAKVNSSGFEKSKKFREEKAELAFEELKLQKFVGSKQNKFQTLKTELEVLLDSEKSEKEKLINFEGQLIKVTDEFQEYTRKKQNAELRIENFRNTIKHMEINIEKLQNDEQQMKTNLNNVRQSLTAKRTAFAETSERSRPIQYILKLKDDGDISGILGRCGDYGRVEGKYDIPASTACGSTDQIVVETSDVAHACIQRLKANNIGRLTFSILPQVQKLKSRANAIHIYPENSSRVFDHIQILDQRFRLTFYSGLYDTLLAENLEQARKIAFGTQTRYRVVTFKGDIIDQSGIMSGGGRAIKGKIGPQKTTSRYAGSISSQVSQNEVESLDKIYKDLEIKLRKTQSNIFDFQANIEKNFRQIEELNIVVKQSLLHLNTLREKEKLLKNLIQKQQSIIAEKKTNPIAIANKEAEIKNAEQELEKAQVEYDKIKSKVDSLKKKIEKITEGEPREAKRLLDETTIKLEAARNGINQVNVDIQASERQIKKSESQIEKLTGYVNESKEKIESNNEEIKKNRKLMKEQLKLLNDLSKNIDEQKKNMKNITNEEDEYSNRNNELRKNKILLKQELENIETIVASNIEKCKRFKLELSKLTLHKIPVIDFKKRDPVNECYQLHESKIQNQNTSTLNKLSKKSEVNLEKDQPNQKQVDEDLDMTLGSDCIEFPQYTYDQLESFNLEKIKYDYMITQEKLKENKPNFSALEEYKIKNQKYNKRVDEVAEVMQLYNDHNEMFNKVRQRRKDEFMASFKRISFTVKNVYQKITLGGDAELELCDSLDPFREGVNFSVRPPKKTWKVISNLSGGEKTLASLVLIFALHHYKPSPIYVMDEIDAALDFKNVSIIANYIKDITQNSQFIVISLRAQMFERANILVGIYKTNDCTSSVTINPRAYESIIYKK